MSLSLRDLFVTVGVDSDSKGFKQLEGSFNRVIGKTIALGVALGTTGLILNKLTKAAGAMEQLDVAFSTLLGSAEKGAALMKELRAFTLTTPFKFSETAEGAKRLLAMGIESNKLIDSLTTLGNISAGVGREKLPQLILAFGQVKTATKLRGQELRQFTEAGVDLLSALQKVTGYDVKALPDLISKGAISFDMVNAALKTSTKEGGRFFNMMIKQSKTFDGTLSIIDDQFQLLAADIGKKFLPLAKKVAEAVNDFATWASNNLDTVTYAVYGLIAALTTLSVFIAGTLIASFIAWATVNWAVLSPILLMMGVLSGLLIIFGAIVLGFEDFIRAMRGEKSVIGTVFKGITAFEHFRVVLRWISKVFGGLIALLFDTEVGVAMLKDAFNEYYTLLKNLGKYIVDSLFGEGTASKIGKWVDSVMAKIKPMFDLIYGDSSLNSKIQINKSFPGAERMLNGGNTTTVAGSKVNVTVVQQPGESSAELVSRMNKDIFSEQLYNAQSEYE